MMQCSWLQCSKSCGEIGMQKRTVKCQSADGEPLPDSSCDIFNRPPDTGICNNGPCSKNRNWQVGPWSAVRNPPYYYSNRHRSYYNHLLRHYPRHYSRGRRSLMHLKKGSQFIKKWYYHVKKEIKVEWKEAMVVDKN